jgi:DNA-binding XRE family transcriptional regulator
MTTTSYTIAVIIFFIVIIGVVGTLMTLIIRALLKYIKSKDVRKEKAETRISLGDALRQHRTECKMTQEFVAETLGVSRQAVSKWENGTSDPTTSNLIALAKLYGVSAEELLKEIEKNGK